MSGQYKVLWLCEALLVSRSGYYDWLRRRERPGPRAQANVVLRARIREEFARSRSTYGSPRLARVSRGRAGRHRIARLRRQEHLRARQRVVDLSAADSALLLPRVAVRRRVHADFHIIRRRALLGRVSLSS